MYSFKNDYSEGAHSNILGALQRSNMIQEEGYGLDNHTKNAIELIKKKLGDCKCDIHLISGGTLTNLIAISSFLRPHEASISVATGHIATHETGAIEAAGHKIITVESDNGKINPELIESVLTEHHFEHMVKPKLVYISNPTELGTVYSKNELKYLHEYCNLKNLILYCDGARLGSALTIKDSDVTLRDLYMTTDAFYIGGTKMGALIGEALVIRNSELKNEFRYLIKQRGALLSKGRVLGIQFEELFNNDLYFKLAKHANSMAQTLAEEMKKLGCSFLIDSPTNQIFPIIENSVINQLLNEFEFYTWEKIDDNHSAVRLITSWATQKKSVDAFIKCYKDLIQ